MLPDRARADAGFEQTRPQPEMRPQVTQYLEVLRHGARIRRVFIPINRYQRKDGENGEKEIE